MVLPLYSTYYRKYEATSELLKKLCEKEEFRAYLQVPLCFLSECVYVLLSLLSHFICNGNLCVQRLQRKSSYNTMLPFEVYLYRPCQRIPQYGLLIRQLLSYTPPDHTDYQNLLRAAEAVHDILELLNKRTQVEQSKRKIKEIEAKLISYDKAPLSEDKSRQYIEEGYWNMLLSFHKSDSSNRSNPSSTPPRSLVSFVRRPSGSVSGEGKESVGHQSKIQTLHVFILSDMLLFVKDKSNGLYKYQFSIALGGAIVSENKAGKFICSCTISLYTFVLQITCSDVVLDGSEIPLMVKARGEKERYFLFKDSKERRKWIETLWSLILVLR